MSSSSSHDQFKLISPKAGTDVAIADSGAEDHGPIHAKGQLPLPFDADARGQTVRKGAH